jgi:hypothetical protein
MDLGYAGPSRYGKTTWRLERLLGCEAEDEVDYGGVAPGFPLPVGGCLQATTSATKATQQPSTTGRPERRTGLVRLHRKWLGFFGIEPRASATDLVRPRGSKPNPGEVEPHVELCHTDGGDRLDTAQLQAREVFVLDHFIPQQIRKVLVYPKPISMAWGPTKLRSFCTDTLGVEPRRNTAFLFTNKKQDTLLLYLVDEDGDQAITKKLDRGAFLMPTAKPDGAPFVTMRRSALSKLFR